MIGMSGAMVLEMNSGDEVQVKGYQTSGGNLDFNCHFSITYMGDGDEATDGTGPSGGITAG